MLPPHACLTVYACVCFCAHVAYTPSPATSLRLLMQQSGYYSVSLLVDCHPVSLGGRLGALQPYLTHIHEWLQQQEAFCVQMCYHLLI